MDIRWWRMVAWVLEYKENVQRYVGGGNLQGSDKFHVVEERYLITENLTA